ncbi:MAG: hypothetical protein Q9M21_01740 [Mariprofundaceae bacterium]|nr:hypothetical protein [Mariprofundaceae bacterium]
MKQLGLLVVLLSISTGTAAAASWNEGVDDRADALEVQLKGNHSYKAHLAREFAGVAVEEKSQHDIQVAKAFMDKAEEYAAQAGGSK